MRPAAAVVMFCLWPGLASAAQYSSVYTAFDLAACRQIEAGDGFMYDGTCACKGDKGIDIVIASADARNFVAFGKDGMKHCAYRQTFTPLNDALSPVEWRLKDGKPIAAIERWRMVVDENGNTATWLVVSALRTGNSCHMHYVAGSFPQANAAARQAADSLAEGFNCETGTATVQSTAAPPPKLFFSCEELAKQ